MKWKTEDKIMQKMGGAK